MSKKSFLSVPFFGLVCFLLFLSACGTAGQRSLTDTPAGTQTGTATPSTATPTPLPTAMPTPTVSQGTFAAFVGNSGGPIVQANEQEYGNITTIHSAVDRPVAYITQPYLSVPPRAKGEVFIQNDSANPQTLVSDTPDGFAPFTIAPYTTTTLVFTRTGNFRSHLQAYPDVTLTIFISMPYS
jgi:hypothetical protein